MANRRQFLKATGGISTLGITGLAGCLEDAPGYGSTEPDATFILTPAESDVEIKEQYRPFVEYLEEETGANIQVNVAADVSAVLQALRSGRADFADASPTLAVAGDEEGIVDILGIRVAYGASRYFSLLTTRPDSGIENISDLKGEEIALGDSSSTSGSIFPLYMLKQGGLDIGNAPDGDPVDFQVNYSDHSVAVEEVLRRDRIKAAGSGAFTSAPYIPQDQFSDTFEEYSVEYEDAGSEDEELSLLAESDPIPRAPILARSDWNADIRSDLQDAMLNAPEEAFTDPNSDAEDLWFSGIEQGTIDEYQSVASVFDELGLEFGN